MAVPSRSTWTRSGACALLLAVLALVPAGAAAAASAPVTSVTMVSETGDYVGQGAARLYHPGNGSVTLQGSPEYLSVHVSGGTQGDTFTVELAAPPGEALQQGHYEHAQRAAFRQAGRPGLDVSGQGRGCNEVEGRFTVLDIAYTGSTVERLHALYEQHCEGSVPALFGEVRYAAEGGSSDLFVAPGHVDWPATYPGAGARPVPVTVVNTGSTPVDVGTAAVTGDGAPSFEVLSSTCAQPLAPADSCRVHVRFTPTSPGDHTAVLTLGDSSGEDVQATVLLQGEGEPGHTSWDMRGEEGEYISDGDVYSWDPTTAAFGAFGQDTFVQVAVDSGAHDFQAQFTPGRNDVLLPGRTYEGTQRYPFNGPAPGLTVSGSGRGCNTSTGRFTVHEIVVGPAGLERFSATFTHFCDDLPQALHGSVAFRAVAPARPLPVPGPERTTFPDIEDSAHRSAVELVAGAGIASGFPDGTFRPRHVVSRGQMATFLVNGLDLPAGSSAGFPDTTSSVHAAAIDAVAAAGIADGFPDGTFRPDLPVTRAQMATFLARGLDLLPAEPGRFPDTADSVHAGAIDAVAAADITAGFDDGTYRPREGVTRGQMATFLTRALDLGQ